MKSCERRKGEARIQEAEWADKPGLIFGTRGARQRVSWRRRVGGRRCDRPGREAGNAGTESGSTRNVVGARSPIEPGVGSRMG